MSESGEQVKIAMLDPEHDEAAAEILADATGEGTIEAARAVIAAARADPDSEIFRARVNDTLVAIYITRREPPTVQLTHLAVAKPYRRRGYGRACLVGALYQAGKRPLVAETDDEGLPFYRACGFRIVRRRKLPDGTMRYRLGTYAPRPGAHHHPPGMAPSPALRADSPPSSGEGE